MNITIFFPVYGHSGKANNYIVRKYGRQFLVLYVWKIRALINHEQAGSYTAHAVVLTKILSQPLRQNVLFSP